jgi:hypothetical protein
MPVIPVLFAIWMLSGRVRRAVVQGMKQPETRGLVYAALLIIALGTLFYRFVEGWRWIDAFYFAVVTLTTVGYGDLTPQTDAGKLFTVFYILTGLGILGSFVGLITQHPLVQRRGGPAAHPPEAAQQGTPAQD